MSTELKCESYAQKKPYAAPALTFFGNVRDLTQAGTRGANESVANGTCDNAPGKKSICPCERVLKTDIHRVGTHARGFGIYLFRYLDEFAGRFGHQKQLGVMVDEVERVMPEAVTFHESGFKAVDLGMLGISRPQ